MPVVAFIHGGGFMVMSPETHAKVAKLIAAGSGAIVVSIEYRRAPQSAGSSGHLIGPRRAKAPEPSGKRAGEFSCRVCVTFPLRPRMYLGVRRARCFVAPVSVWVR